MRRLLRIRPGTICQIALTVAVLLLTPLSSFPQSPSWPPMGQLVGGTPWDIAIEGNFAYVAAGVALTILDVSDPSQPRLAGYWISGGKTRDVAVSDRVAYVAAGAAGLCVVDVSDSAHPVLIGQFTTRGPAEGLALSNGIAYVVGGYPGVDVIDVSNCRAPAGLCHWDGAPARDVIVNDGYAYVTCVGADGDGYWRVVSILDISNVIEPRQVGRLEILGHGPVEVSGRYAYIAEFEQGIRVMDVSDPANPVAVGLWECPGAWGTSMEVVGRYLYLSARWGTPGPDRLSVVDISVPVNPREVGSRGAATGRVAVVGGRAYVASPDVGVTVIDVSVPSQPAHMGHWVAPDSTQDVAMANGCAYAASYGIHIVDLSDPANPLRVGWWAAWAYFHGASCMAPADRYIYVTNCYPGFQAVDISNPSHPCDVWPDTYFWARAVTVSGTYAYLVDRGLRVINIADPARPRLVAGIASPYSSENVAAAEGYAYVAEFAQGLWVVDVSDPTNPRSVARCRLPDGALGVTLSGHYAYVAGGSAGLRIVDVRKPRRPIEVGYYDSPGDCCDVAVAGRHAYIADGECGLRVVDVSNPRKPHEAAHWQTAGQARAVAALNGLVCLGDYGWGLLIFPEYPSGQLVGRVRERRAATTVGGARVEVYLDGKRKATTVTDSGGAYRISGLASGDYAIRVSKSGYVTDVEAPVWVVCSKTRRCDFRLERLGSWSR